jgi:1A family penicillin-binding protein
LYNTITMWRDQLARSRVRMRRQFAQYRPSPGVEKSKRLAKIAKILFISVITVFLGGLALFPLMAASLPSPDKIVRTEGFSSKIVDRNGKSLYDIFVDQKSTPVEFEDMPVYLRQATVAIEDKNFYTHQGFDPLGYVRAVYYFVTGRRRLQGGSTLTQQLVKNVLLTNERSVIRKIREFVLTLEIERRYSKDDILRMYLNEAPYGGNTRGVEAASEMYFNKNVKDLNLVESAFLAGLPQRPSTYSPYTSSNKAYVPRTVAVLRRMREDGYITQDQEKEANDQLANITFAPKATEFKAPHFVQYVQKILEGRYDERLLEQGGLTITTTLDLSLQEKAQSIVADEIFKATKLGIGNGAAVVLDPQTGEILAMVGSKDFNAKDYDGQVNVATSLRQPGSAIKPFTYVTAFQKGYTPATLIMDVPTTFPGGIGQPDYNPVNYDGKYRGPIQIRYALANSINIPAVKMLAKVGIREVLATAYDMGITTLEPTKQTLDRVGLSLTLGGGEVRLLELTDAYGGFMNGGYRINPVSILKVVDHDGKVLEETNPQKGKQVISSENAFLITNILSDNNARSLVFGPNSLLNIPGRSIAVKTGTTNDKRDNWAIGGNPQVVVGSWVGNNDNSPMKEVASGVSGASPIWRRILLEALKDKPPVDFEMPSNILQMDVDIVSGYPAHDGFPSRSEYFVKGTEPSGDDPFHLKLKVCKNDDKLATPSDIAANNYEEKEYFAFKEEDPTASSGGPNKWQEGILNWIATQNNPAYNPPTDYCGTANPVNVEFKAPTDRTSNLPTTFNIKISADSTSDIAVLQLEVDGTKVRSFTGLPYEYEATLEKGVHQLRAIAIDAKGDQSDRRITIGVGTNWDESATSQ